jgi:hypothetical protein
MTKVGGNERHQHPPLAEAELACAPADAKAKLRHATTADARVASDGRGVVLLVRASVSAAGLHTASATLPRQAGSSRAVGSPGCAVFLDAVAFLDP